ncbi:unnamed protein product [Mytilus coruscus]|uniref:Methyltransferase FkbM domain-containing protein n=1 Tax=Mytilus coruscus TaxID=42192 RepID=A0A6J8DC44_MYTCO|nr:unnamed protein product [Mytilus coruscus]
MRPTILMSYQAAIITDTHNSFLQRQDDSRSHLYDRDATDPELINYVRKNFIKHFQSDPYNFTTPWREHPTREQSKQIDKFLHKQTNGTFVDIGANDGEQDSVTLFFERWRNWTGLLVEPNPSKYDTIKQKHRRALTVNACVKTNKNESEMLFSQNKKIPCFWTDTILYALNKHQIDLLNIDVSGKEMDILKSVAHDKFFIRVITVEFAIDILPELQNIFAYMDKRGYVAIHQYINQGIQKTDVMFVNKRALNSPS